MQTITRALTAVALIVAVAPVNAAGAQVGPDMIDPHFDFSEADLSVGPDGELWVTLTPAEAWEDGPPEDPFSAFFEVNVSNDEVRSGSGWQVHSGEESTFGSSDGPGTPGEFTPRVFLIDGGRRLRVSTAVMPVGPGDSPLFFQVGAASMATDGAPRIEAPGLAGQVGSDLVVTDPLLDATHEFTGGLFVEILDPITSADQPDPDDVEGSDVIEGDTTGDIVPTDEIGSDPDDDIDIDIDEPATGSDKTNALSRTSSGDDGGSDSKVVIGALIALVIAVFAWMALKRKARVAAELADAGAIAQEVLNNIEPPADEG